MAERISPASRCAPTSDSSPAALVAPGRDRAVERAVEILHHHIEVNRRPMTPIVACRAPRRRRSRSALFREQVHTKAAACELRDRSAEAARQLELERLRVKTMP